MATLPRGVQAIPFKDKQTKRITIKYRVQVRKKTFSVDRLLDNEEDAIKFWEDTRTPEGRLAIAEGRDRTSERSKAIYQATVEALTGGSLTVGQLIDLKNKDYESIIANNKTEDKDRRTAKVNRDRLKKIKTILVSYIPDGALTPSGQFAHLQKFAKSNRSKTFGDFGLEELDPVIVTNYIKTRRAGGIAKSTIKREIGAMQALVNKLEYTDKNAWKRLNGVNPFDSYDKSLVKGGVKHRKTTISEEQEDIFLSAMAKHRNKEYALIFATGMMTAMRRAEILSLRWSQINTKERWIDLDPEQAKDGEERFISMPKELASAFEAFERVDDRVFHLTIEGFKTGFQRIRKSVGLEGVNFHDTRRSGISRMLDSLGPSPVKIAAAVGAKSVRNLVDTTIKPLQRMKRVMDGNVLSQQDVMDQAGHRKEETHFGYYSPKK